MRRALLLAAAAAALAGATLLALLAGDVLAWKQALAAGDRAYAAGAPHPVWRIDASFPFATARALLGIDDDLAYRKALVAYHGRTVAPAFDNGVSRREAEAEAEIALSQVEQGDRDHARASQAANLLGILAIGGPSPLAPDEPTPSDRALSEFQNAIRLDPGDEEAKANLELLLRQLVAHGRRQGGSAGQAGRSSGREGAGLSPPGQGY